MKQLENNIFLYTATILVISTSLLLSACTNLIPVQPQQPQPPVTPPPSSNQPSQITDYKVIYNYNDTNKVQLSANDLVLKVGDKLTLVPAAGLTKSTRFRSAGEYFFGDIMEQQSTSPESGKVVFVAKKPGKGKLQIIPNNTEIDRATDLMVTVK